MKTKVIKATLYKYNNLNKYFILIKYKTNGGFSSCEIKNDNVIIHFITSGIEEDKNVCIIKMPSDSFEITDCMSYIENDEKFIKIYLKKNDGECADMIEMCDLTIEMK